MSEAIRRRRIILAFSRIIRPLVEWRSLSRV